MLRRFGSFVGAVAVLLLAVALVGCGDDGGGDGDDCASNPGGAGCSSSHTHIYGTWVITPATCGAAGDSTRTCTAAGCTTPVAKVTRPIPQLSGAQCITTPKVGQFTDSRDGKVYDSVRIGTQVWMAENLNYAEPKIGSDSSSYCYDNDPSNCAIFGRLYTWNAALTACPSGWHLSNDVEWMVLTNFVGGSENAGKYLKAVSPYWNTYSGITNEDTFGFSALPGGRRNYLHGGSFTGVGNNGYWWNSTEVGATTARLREMQYNHYAAGRYDGDKSVAFSVRCVRD